MLNKRDRKIVLENGSEFYGTGFGARCDGIFEAAFHTSMAGYQEIISDPASAGQMLIMTYPLIGNYGITDDDFESKEPVIGGLVVREYNDSPSNFRWTKTLSEVLEENNIPGISGVDTRRITRMIRDEGTQKIMITSWDKPLAQALAEIKAYAMPRDLVARVGSQKRWYSRTANPIYNVVAIDCGIKLSVVRKLNDCGCNVTVVPCHTTVEEILSLKPNGVFLSDGPGNPDDVPEVVALVSHLRGKLPIFGMGLGYQLICLAYGAKTYKLKFGRHGGNHPVKETATGLIAVTGQNRGYAVDMDSLAATGLTLTHVSVLDGTPEGVCCDADNLMGVQFYPETAPGPHDGAHLFARFMYMMEQEAN